MPKLSAAQEAAMERFRAGETVMTTKGLNPSAFWRNSMEHMNFATLIALRKRELIVATKDDWRGATYVIAPQTAIDPA